MILFDLPDVPLTANKYRHLHWAKKRKEVLLWRLRIKAKLGGRGPKEKRRAKVTIVVRRWRRRQDLVNFFTSLKPVEDALVQEGWLHDDSREWIDSHYDEVLAKRDQQGTRIEIEYL